MKKVGGILGFLAICAIVAASMGWLTDLLFSILPLAIAWGIVAAVIVLCWNVEELFD